MFAAVIVSQILCPNSKYFASSDIKFLCASFSVDFAWTADFSPFSPLSSVAFCLSFRTQTHIYRLAVPSFRCVPFASFSRILCSLSLCFRPINQIIFHYKQQQKVEERKLPLPFFICVFSFLSFSRTLSELV